MAKKVERKAKIIFDKPAETDAFDGGGHQRCAQALADSIEQLANRDGAIGLEGSWGAGKSTVINLAEEVLGNKKSDKNKYHVFTFDLWEHQSDNFRRAFLEEFVNWLRINKHLKPKDAKEVKDRIRNRVRTVSTSRLKEYSFFASTLLLLTPLIPLLYAWMGPAAFKIEDTNKPFSFDIWQAGLVIFALIYIVFILKTVWGMSEVVKDENGNKISFGFWSKLNRSVSKSLSLFVKDIEKEDSKQSIKEVDPTTIEFHGVFRDLLSKVQKKNKRIVFVLDNIDRLPTSQVPEIWSEVRSLFSNTTFETSLDNAWVTAVIPYDKPFIKQAFESEREVDPQEASIESDIIGKTFSVILHVSPPVATDWGNFFMMQLDKAFTPYFENETKFRLFRILKYYFQEKGTHPTPRTLITFINDMSSLWMQWGDVLTLESMALYIIHRPHIEGNPSSILNSHLVEEHYKNIAHIEDWQRDFASLSYNVDPDIAYQVLLQQPIVAALTNSDSSDLIELSKSKIGFKEIFMDALDEALGSLDQKEALLVSNIAKNIDSIDLSKELKKEVWLKMARHSSSISSFDLADPNSFEGVFTVVQNQEKDRLLSFSNILRQKLTSSVSLEEHGDNPEATKDEFRKSGYAWLMAISKIGDLIKNKFNKDKRDEFYQKTYIPNNPDVCLGAAFACAEIDDISFKELGFRGEPKGIIESFVYNDLVETEESAEQFRSTLNELSHLISDEGCTSLLDLIAQCMRSQDIKTAKSRSEIIESYITLYYSREADDTFKAHLDTLANEGTLIWHGYKAHEENSIEVVSIIQWLMFVVFGNKDSSGIPDHHNTLGQLNEAKSWYNQSITSMDIQAIQIETLARKVTKHNRFRGWMKCAIEDNTENKIYTRVFAKILEEKKYNRLPVKESVLHYEKIKHAVGEVLAKSFLDEFRRWNEHFEEALTGDDINKIPSSFIADTATLKNKADYEILFNKIDEYLRSSSQEDWENSLKAEDDRLRLLIARRETSNITLSVEIYRPALLSHILSILESDFTPPFNFSENYDQVFNALKAANRKQLASDVLKAFSTISVSKDGCEQLIKSFPKLVEEMPYATHADDTIDHFFSKILSSELEEVKDFIRNKASVIKKCLKKSSDISSKSFEEILESLEESKGENIGEWLPEIRKLLNLKKKKPKPANDSEPPNKKEDKAQ